MAKQEITDVLKAIPLFATAKTVVELYKECDRSGALGAGGTSFITVHGEELALAAMWAVAHGYVPE